MKVYIGPYYHWFRPGKWYKDWVLWAHGFGYKTDYETVDMQKLDDTEARIRKSWIYGKLRDLENWIENRHEREISVKIHDYDVWGMDHTLSLIILPMLKRLKEKKQGSPHVDDVDVPEELRSTAAPPKTDAEKRMDCTDAYFHERWVWALNEMIWAMEQVADEDSDSAFYEHPPENDSLSCAELVRRMKFDKEGYMKWQARKQHGLLLFGKYFEALWD